MPNSQDQSPHSAAIGQLARAIADVLAEVAAPRAPESSAEGNSAPTWQEKLWTVDPNVRVGVRELAEGLGRSRAYIYRLTRTAAIPHRKLDGQLLFRVGDIRQWLKERENVIVTPALTVVRR